MNTTTTRVSRKNTPRAMDKKLRIKVINRIIADHYIKRLEKTDVEWTRVADDFYLKGTDIKQMT
jgi:hypothetical protein